MAKTTDKLLIWGFVCLVFLNSWQTFNRQTDLETAVHFLVVLTSESEIGIVSTSSENEALLLCRGAAVCRQLPQFLQPRKITNIFFFSLLDHEKNHLQAYLLCVQNLFPPLCWYIWHILHVLQDYYPRFNTYLSLSFSYSAKSHHIHYIFYQRLFLDNERLKMHLWFGSAHLFDSKTVDFWQWANNVVALSIPNTSIHISDRD